MISNQISVLLNIDNVKGQIITSELSFKQLISLLSSLLIEKLGEDNSLFLEFKELKKKLYEFENFRNLVAHSIWAHSQDYSPTKASMFKTTSKEKRGLKYQHEEFRLDEIVERLEKAADTNIKLLYLLTKITGKKIDRITIK